MGSLNFYDFAENDYRFVAQAYQAGLRGNALGYLAEQACEKYIKHVLCLVENLDASIPGEAQRYPREETHHPGKLAKKLREYDIIVPGSFIHKMNTISTYYRDTRYPGYYTSHEIDEDETKECMQCMKDCRVFVRNIIQNLEIKKAAEHDNDDIDFDI